MAEVDIENIDFAVEISEESDLDIVLAIIDESLEIVMTFVKEDNVFLVTHAQHNLELSFVKDSVQTTIHKLELPPKPFVERSVFICKKCTKNFQLKGIYLKHVDVCQSYLPPVRKSRKRQSTGETLSTRR